MATLMLRSLPSWEVFDPETKLQNHQQIVDDLAGVEKPTVESVMEFAARVCYVSTAKMDTSPHFLTKKIMQNGHHDVIEHGYAAVVAKPDEIEPEKYIQRISDGDGNIIAAGNIRAWYDLKDKYPWIVEIIGPIAPKIFDVEDVSEIVVVDSGTKPSQNVIMLANTYLAEDVGHATFLISGISRACGYQLVRHRTLSFSQESQRYANTTTNEPIYPKSILKNDIAIEIAQTIHEQTKDAYEQLRELGIKMEDARCVLPNMAQTRMVVSGDVKAWRHFLDLRTAKDAQKEIRDVANQIKIILEKSWGSG